MSWEGKQVGELELNPEDQLETGKENATGAEQGGNGKKIVRHFGETQKRASAGRKNFWSAKCEKNLCGQKQEFIQVYNIEGAEMLQDATTEGCGLEEMTKTQENLEKEQEQCFICDAPADFNCPACQVPICKHHRDYHQAGTISPKLTSKVVLLSLGGVF